MGRRAEKGEKKRKYTGITRGLVKVRILIPQVWGGGLKTQFVKNPREALLADRRHTGVRGESTQGEQTSLIQMRCSAPPPDYLDVIDSRGHRHRYLKTSPVTIICS